MYEQSSNFVSAIGCHNNFAEYTCPCLTDRNKVNEFSTMYVNPTPWNALIYAAYTPRIAKKTCHMCHVLDTTPGSVLLDNTTASCVPQLNWWFAPHRSREWIRWWTCPVATNVNLFACILKKLSDIVTWVMWESFYRSLSSHGITIMWGRVGTTWFTENHIWYMSNVSAKAIKIMSGCEGPIYSNQSKSMYQEGVFPCIFYFVYDLSRKWFGNGQSNYLIRTYQQTKTVMMVVKIKA